MFSKTYSKLIENRSSRSKVIQNSIDYLECGNFSQGAETPGTERDITFSLLTVKGLKKIPHSNEDKTILIN
jgi:phage anti-repressor protein